MKKLLRLALLSLSLTVHAQNFWAETTPPYPTHPDYFVKSISIVDENVVWVSGSDIENNTGWASVSLDSGNTWTEMPIDLGSIQLPVSNIHAVSATTAYACCYPNTIEVKGGVWVTFDSGANWTQQQPEMYSGVNAFPEFVHFWDQNNGLIVGDPTLGYFEIYTTVDGGLNWIRVPQENIPSPNFAEYPHPTRYEVKGDTIWFITNQHRLFKSIDRGANWTIASAMIVDSDDTYIFNFSFKNPESGIMISSGSVGNPAQYFNSNDSGSNWNITFPNGNYRSKIVSVPETDGTYFSFGLDIQNGTPGASYSIDDGMNWVDLNTVDDSPVTPQIAQFLNAERGYCSGYYVSEAGNPTMRFFRFDSPLLKTHPFEKEDQLLASPNPTDGIVEFSGKSIQSVAIVDAFGKIILQQHFSLLDDAVVDLSAFQNGVYFATVIGNSGALKTVKIVKK